MTIDLNEKIFNLVNQDEAIVSILLELGFKDIMKPGMLKTVGKIMTLKKGAKFRKIDLNDIIKKFEEKGYKVVGNDE